MDLVRLGVVGTTTYTADKLIEGYNSLIWTERRQTHGEFELKSFDIDGLLADLPAGTFLSHLETREMMVVETHEINEVGEGADAKDELTIRGRSATLILEKRWIESSYQKKRRLRKKYTATAAAGVLLVNSVDNASGKDLTRGDDDPDTKIERNDYSWNTKDVIPNVAVTESVAVETSTRWWQVEEGILYPQLMSILVDADLGLRCMRPVSPNPATVITVQSALATRGTVVRTANPDVSQLRFDIYQGVDRSSTVQFSRLQGHISKPQHLDSERDYANVVEIKSGEVTLSDVYEEGQVSATGWTRKIMDFDAGSPELPPEPEKPAELKSNATAAQKQNRREAMDEWIDDYAKWKNKRDRIVADFKEEQLLAAKRELKKRRRVNMFSGDISALSPYVYQKDYYLGDAVMLFGDYGKSAKMIVDEYVRTEDAGGDRGFPGLVEP